MSRPLSIDTDGLPYARNGRLFGHKGNKIRWFDVQHTQIPIIALTASMMDEDKEARRLTGMNDFLGKPITVAQFTAMLQKWIVVE